MAISSTNLTDTTGIQLKDAFVVIIKTEWNADLVNELASGCIDVLANNNIKFKILTVPGAFELPFAVSKYWQKSQASLRIKTPDAFITLGCVIKGDTPHFDYVCMGVTQGIMALNTQLTVPTIFGVLTVNNLEQAKERLGGSHGHKGKEAAAAAIKLIAFSESL
jgi:6,7-dimethyl-8-ribityllumazine synthase